mgnify:CR=1 FL=1
MKWGDKMLKNINDNLEQLLNKFIEKTVIINQNGFVESTYSINKLKYSIEYDILNIIDENSENYIKINLNQVYKLENKEDKIILYLDNDITITLNFKR